MAEQNCSNSQNTADLETQTVLRAAAGDNAAFAEIAHRFEPAILRILSSIKIPEADRNDLYQEGLIGLYKAVHLYNPSLSSFSTFGYVCIRSGIADGLRRYQREHSLKAVEISADEIPDKSAGSPERILLGKEELSSVLERIGKTLSTMERKVFGLHLQGKSSSEIARILERDQKSVENTLFRARRKLAKLS